MYCAHTLAEKNLEAEFNILSHLWNDIGKHKVARCKPPIFSTSSR